MKYRDRLTGEIIFGGEVKIRAQSRKLSGPMVPNQKQSREPVETIIGVVFLVADETQWGQFEYDLAMVDPIMDQAQPDYDDFTQGLQEVAPIQGDDGWYQNWEITERFKDVGELRAALILKLKGIADLVRASGVTVNGIKVRTDSIGIADLVGAAMSGRTSFIYVSGDEAVKITNTEINAMIKKAEKHVQACYTRQGKGINALKASADPMSVDLKTGWPLNV